MRGLAVLGSTICMTSFTACTAHQPMDQNTVGFLCAVDSTKMIRPNMSDEAVCALFKVQIDDVLKQKTIAVDDASHALPPNWLKIEVRFSMPGTASASLVQSTGGKDTVHPEIAVDVMDKAMEPKDVGMLASAVAKYLAETPQR